MQLITAADFKHAANASQVASGKYAIGLYFGYPRKGSKSLFVAASRGPNLIFTRDLKIRGLTDAVRKIGGLIEDGILQQPDIVVVGAIGMGNGLCDALTSGAGFKVARYIGSTASTSDKWDDLHSQVWHTVGSAFAEGFVSIEAGAVSNDLESQMTLLEYVIENGTVRVEARGGWKYNLQRDISLAQAVVLSLYPNIPTA